MRTPQMLTSHAKVEENNGCPKRTVRGRTSPVPRWLVLTCCASVFTMTGTRTHLLDLPHFDFEQQKKEIDVSATLRILWERFACVDHHLIPWLPLPFTWSRSWRTYIASHLAFPAKPGTRTLSCIMDPHGFEEEALDCLWTGALPQLGSGCCWWVIVPSQGR